MLRHWTLSVPSSSHLCSGQWESTEHISEIWFCEQQLCIGNNVSVFFSFIPNENRSEKIDTFSFVPWFSHSMPFVVRPLLDKMYWRCVSALFCCVLIYCVVFLNGWNANKEEHIEKVVICVYTLCSHWPIDTNASAVSRQTGMWEWWVSTRNTFSQTA